MKQKKTEVVVTSCGMIASLGIGLEPCWKKLLAGQTGQFPIQRFAANRYAQKSLCPVLEIPEPGFKPPYPLDAASRILLCAMQEALAAVPREATRNAPVFIATTLGGMDNGTRFFRSYEEHGLTAENQAVLKDYLPFMQGRHAQSHFGFRRMPHIVTNACSSGANAIGLAWLAIQSGRTPIAVAAGYDIVSEFVFGGFHSLRLVAPDCCRPFDAGRKGLVLGEGAGALVLETRESAARANRPALAQVSGYAGATEAYHVTKPHPDGLGAHRIMEDCLASAGVRPEEVSCVNAHGTGTAQNDLMEARAIARLFAGNKGLAVTANKGAIGHTLGASGILEGIFSALSIRDQVVPPTANTREPIPELASARLVIGRPQPGPIRHVVSTSFGFGGTNAAILFSALE